MAFYLLQVLFGSVLLIVATVLLIVATILWAAGTHSEQSQYAKIVGSWGLAFAAVGAVVILTA